MGDEDYASTPRSSVVAREVIESAMPAPKSPGHRGGKHLPRRGLGRRGYGRVTGDQMGMLATVIKPGDADSMEKLAPNAG